MPAGGSMARPQLVDPDTCGLTQPTTPTVTSWRTAIALYRPSAEHIGSRPVSLEGASSPATGDAAASVTGRASASEAVTTALIMGSAADTEKVRTSPVDLPMDFALRLLLPVASTHKASLQAPVRKAAIEGVDRRCAAVVRVTAVVPVTADADRLGSDTRLRIGWLSTGGLIAGPQGLVIGPLFLRTVGQQRDNLSGSGHCEVDRRLAPVVPERARVSKS